MLLSQAKDTFKVKSVFDHEDPDQVFTVTASEDIDSNTVVSDTITIYSFRINAEAGAFEEIRTDKRFMIEVIPLENPVSSTYKDCLVGKTEEFIKLID